MDVREVTVRYGRTANIRPFESERIDVELTAVVGEGELWVSVTHDLGITAKDTVDVQLREFERQRRDAVTRRIRRSNDPEDHGPPEEDER